jgi:hypothetical protein
MAFAKQFPNGLTPNVSTLPATKIAQIDINQSRAVDGTAGGTYPADITWQGQHTLEKFPALNHASLNNLNRCQALKVVGAQTATSFTVTLNANCSSIDTKPGAAVADAILLDLSEVPDGAVLRAVTITTIGLGAVNPPSSKATYQIQRHDRFSNLGNMSAVTDDAHTYGPGNWLTTQIDTVINTNASQTIDKGNYLYVLKVSSPFDVGVGSQMRITGLRLTYDAKKLSS